MEWEDLRYFLAAARNGSFSGAAKALRTTQPTMGRRIDAFEARMGVRLFERRPSGLQLTEAGLAILSLAESMEEMALAAERMIFGRDAGLAGAVRISAPEWYALRVLAPLAGAFAAAQPDITIELQAEARTVNLARREADIAFRFRGFERDGIYQRKLGDIAFELYASPDYLARKGSPDFASKGAGASIVTVSHELADGVAETAWLDEFLGSAHRALRCDSRIAQAGAVTAGAGLACLPKMLGDVWGGLSRVEVPKALPVRELFMGLSAASRAIPRVKLLADYLEAALRKQKPGTKG